MQTIYLKIINTLYKYTSFISAKTRDVLLSLCFVVAAMRYVLEYSGHSVLPNDEYKEWFMFVMLVLVTIFSTQHDVEKVRIRKHVAVVYFLFIATILFARMLHPIRPEIVVFALDLLIMPAFYIVWADRGDINRLFDRIAIIWAAVGAGFYLISLVCVPPEGIHFREDRYFGFAFNPNILGMITISVAAAALYLIMQRRLQTLAVIDIGVSFIMLWLSGSRAAMLADVCMIIIFAVIYILRKDPLQRGKKQVLICLVLSCEIAALGACTALIFAEQMGFEDITDGVQQELEEQDPDVSEEDKAELVNKFTSGRIEVYTQIIEQINFTGHEPAPFYYFNGKKTLYAHNTPLDFAFSCGVLSGLASLTLFIITAIYVLISLFGKDSIAPGRTYALLIMTGFGIESMLEIELQFGNRDLVLLFYIVFAEIFAMGKTGCGSAPEPGSERV